MDGSKDCKIVHNPRCSSTLMVNFVHVLAIYDLKKFIDNARVGENDSLRLGIANVLQELADIEEEFKNCSA